MTTSKRPIIAITTDLKEKNNSIEVGYSSAVAKYGGTPVLIPTIPEALDHIEDIIGMIDGFLIPGSRDMDPKYYNQRPLAELRPMSDERTKAEICLTEKAVSRGIPILGICGGMQFLNVFFGGTLYQDINSLIQDALDHEKGAAHDIEVVEDTFLSGILEDRLFSVESYHHQAIDKIGKDLRANAFSPDGIVEGIEKSGSYIVGIQWHPELEDTVHNRRIFESFLEACSVQA